MIRIYVDLHATTQPKLTEQLDLTETRNRHARAGDRTGEVRHRRGPAAGAVRRSVFGLCGAQATPLSRSTAARVEPTLQKSTATTFGRRTASRHRAAWP